MLLPDGKRASFAGEAPSLAAFLNAAFAGGGTFRLESNQKTAERLFRTPFSAGVGVSEVTAEWLEKT